MRRFCNVVYAYLVEGADEQGIEKMDGLLDAPLVGERAPRRRGPDPGMAAMMAAFAKAER